MKNTSFSSFTNIANRQFEKINKTKILFFKEFSNLRKIMSLKLYDFQKHFMIGT